jgi:hypothetical protein
MIVVALLVMAGGVAQAKDIRFVSGLTQDQFKDLSREAGAALSYHNVAPSVSLGWTGFDLAVEATAIEIKKGTYWDAAFSGDAPSYLVIPRLRARKGLPFGIDVGAMYSSVPDSNVKLFGVEVAKALIDGGLITPSLGLRGSYTKLTGVDELELQTYAADACLSKGFVLVTPYIGAGVVQIVSKPKGAVIGGLAEEKITQPRYFGGLKLSLLPLMGITAEVEYAERPAYSLKAAINF